MLAIADITAGRDRMKNSAIRATKHRQFANAGKQVRLRAFIRDYRRAAVCLGRIQMRAWHETGSIPLVHGSKTENARMGGAPAQMVAKHVREALKSYWANRRNDYRDAVTRSSLPRSTKHKLHQLNRSGRIFHGETHIDDETRQLAQSIWRGVRKRHRLPDLGNLSARVDHRCGIIERKKKASKFDLWVHFRLPRHGNFWMPLQDHAGRQRRKAPMARTLQLVTEPEGGITVRLFSDETERAMATRQAYVPKTETIGLDFGLSTMFATSEGDLLGRKWIEDLRKRDANLNRIARGVQRAGVKLHGAKRYRRAKQQLRGFVDTEIRRVLNRLVEVRAPGLIVLERLDFRSPKLSKRLNHILSNCGRSVIRTKLEDLKLRHDIDAMEVNAAYSSQECNSCHHVSRANRGKQSSFLCTKCGYAIHADVGGARNIESRRSWPERARLGGKAAALGEIAKRSTTGVSGASVPPDALASTE